MFSGLIGNDASQRHKRRMHHIARLLLALFLLAVPACNFQAPAIQDNGIDRDR